MLREEPQYRLLFFGQLLSILGDRVMMVVLPFAVLSSSVGGGVGDVAIVSAAQFLPFAILALPAGVWADRLDRKKILITSDATRFCCQLTAGVLLVTGSATVLHLACWPPSTGPPTRSSRPPSPACCRGPSRRSTSSPPTRCAA